MAYLHRSRLLMSLLYLQVSAGEMEWYKDMGPSVDKIERQSRNLQCTACHKPVSSIMDLFQLT